MSVRILSGIGWEFNELGTQTIVRGAYPAACNHKMIVFDHAPAGLYTIKEASFQPLDEKGNN